MPDKHSVLSITTVWNSRYIVDQAARRLRATDTWKVYRAVPQSYASHTQSNVRQRMPK